MGLTKSPLVDWVTQGYPENAPEDTFVTREKGSRRHHSVVS